MMKLLLDTNVLIWWFEDPKQITKEARDAIKKSEHLVYVSAAAIWEIVIKKSLRKLESPDNLSELLTEENFLPLPVTAAHAFALQTLPLHHRDPFDRIQIIQAQSENLKFVTRDSEIMKYDVPIILA